MDSKVFSEKLGGSSSQFTQLIKGDAEKIQEISDKLEAAEGNSKQGQIGWTFASEKAEAARGLLQEMKSHVLDEATAASKIVEQFDNFGHDSQENKNLVQAKTSQSEQIKNIKNRAGELIDQFARIEQIEQRVGTLQDGQQDKDMNKFISELQTGMKKIE